MRNGGLFHIILDVLFEENHYSSIVLKEINNELLVIKEPRTYVTVPNVNCILGDKLTAFAPHTTGIPFGVDKEMEIMKQMYDISTLIDVIDDFTEVRDTYKKFVKAEIAYRGLDITNKEVLEGTIRATFCIISKGSSDKDEFPLYKYGANSVKLHIFSEKYSGELATIQACKVLYLAACVFVDADQMIKLTSLKIT